MSRKPNTVVRKKILKAAHSLMFTQGFNGVSMDDVARAAGVKKANLFHYFPSKQTLGLAVFDHAVTESEDPVAVLLADPNSDPLATVEVMFEQASRRMKSTGCSGGCFVGNTAQELSDCSETLRCKVASYLKQWSGQWASFLQKKKDAGYFNSEFDAHAAAVGLLGLFEGAMLFSKASRSTGPLEHAKQLAKQHFESLRS